MSGYGRRHVIVNMQPETAVYLNPHGQIVVRQTDVRDLSGDDSDMWIIISREHVRAIVNALLEIEPHAGLFVDEDEDEGEISPSPSLSLSATADRATAEPARARGRGAQSRRQEQSADRDRVRVRRKHGAPNRGGDCAIECARRAPGVRHQCAMTHPRRTRS